jgi:CheY-like chemotaxis protein
MFHVTEPNSGSAHTHHCWQHAPPSSLSTPRLFPSMIRDDSDVTGLLHLSRALSRGDAVAFLGPDFSSFAGAPTRSDLARWLRADLNPSTRTTSLPAVAQAYRDQFGDYALCARLGWALNGRAITPSRAHYLLCELPFLVHVTPSLDSSYEDMLHSLRYPINVIADARSIVDWDEMREVQVVKPYGDVTRPDTIALSERDVAHVLRRGSPLREKLSALLHYRTVLFVDCSMGDPDFVRLLTEITEDGPSAARPAFAITFDTDPLLLAEWRRRNIRPIIADETGTTRDAALAKTLDALTVLVGTRPTGCDILVVDDEPSLRTGLKMMIERALPHLKVEAIEDGIGALLVIPSLRPTLVIVDLIMPRMDGWKLIDALRVDPRYSHLRYIVLTGMENPDWMKKAEALGIPYIMKPFDREPFLQAVEQQLAPRQVR